MDGEARDLIEAAAEMAHAALEARARRIDPDEVISRSVQMSRIKTRDILKQLREPPLTPFTGLPKPLQAQMFNLSALMQDADTPEQMDAVFDAIRAVTFHRAAREDTETTAEIQKPVGLYKP